MFVVFPSPASIPTLLNSSISSSGGPSLPFLCPCSWAHVGQDWLTRTPVIGSPEPPSEGFPSDFHLGFAELTEWHCRGPVWLHGEETSLCVRPAWRKQG